MLQAGTIAGMPVSLGVQILEISGGGVLLQSSRPVNIGQRAALRLSIGGHAFATEVTVTRVTPSSEEGPYRIGATFVTIKPEDRQLIERFTRE
jgi:PilZ domain